MTALDDLKAAAANEGAVLNALMDDVDDLAGKLAAAHQADDSDAIKDIVKQMQDVTGKAQAKLNPPADTTGGGQASDTTPPAQAS